jgi:hypothetical protein
VMASRGKTSVDAARLHFLRNEPRWKALPPSS